MLTFRLLEVFRHVVDTGSITLASSQLKLSQPTVSLQIKKLSAEVGLSLIEVHQGQFKMTEAGKAVYQCAQEIYASQQRLSTQVKAIEGIEKGQLSIVVVTTAKYVIPPVLGEFCKSHQGLDIRFQVRNRAQVLERLEKNQDDIYIFSHPPTSIKTHRQRFMTNKLQVIAPADYQGPNHCRLKDIAGQRFLMREQGSGTRMSIEHYCNKNAVNLTNTMLVESNEAIKLSVGSGLGLAILSEHTLAQGDMSSIKVLNIDDFPLNTHWYAVTPEHRPQNLACKAFLTFLTSFSSHIQ